MANKTVGILTGGGDCPGLNAVIRAAYRAAARSTKIGMDDISEAAKQECAAAGKLYRVIANNDDF